MLSRGGRIAARKLVSKPNLAPPVGAALQRDISAPVERLSTAFPRPRSIHQVTPLRPVDPARSVPTLLPPRLADKTCLVTGASSGLGRAIAFAYASHGARHIVCADLQPNARPGVDGESKPAHEVINEMYGKEMASFAKCDVTKAGEVQDAVEAAVERGGGRLDVMVNNAGLGTVNRYIRLHELEEMEWDNVMRVNSTGVYLGCKYALAQFLKQGLGAHGRRGFIINVSSILGHVGITGGAGVYCASKAAALNLTRQIALDYAKDKIHCNALCPGFMKTAMTVENYTVEAVNAEMIAKTPWGEWGNVQDVARGAVTLASDDVLGITGIGLPVDGGFLAQ